MKKIPFRAGLYLAFLLLPAFFLTKAVNAAPTHIKCLHAFVINDTLPAGKKPVASIEVNKSKNEITVTYVDGSSEKMTEAEALKKDFVSRDGYGNFKTAPVSGRQTGIVVNSAGKPLYVIEGREVSDDALGSINPNNIESINVLKGKTALDKYGVKGKDGVVEIKLKSAVSGDGLNKEISDAATLKKWIGAKEGDEVQSYSLLKNGTDDEITRVDVKGSDFSAAAKRFLSQLKPGDSFSIEKIMIKRNGTMTLLPSVVHKF